MEAWAKGMTGVKKWERCGMAGCGSPYKAPMGG